MTSVKFLDLLTQYHAIKPEIDEAVLAVLGSGQYVLGPEVEAFEREFAAAHDVAEAIALNSGTSALHIALLALGVGPGDEVLLPAMTFTATAAAISYTGATPVLVDVDFDTCTMDPEEARAKVTGRTKAIMPVHLYGQSADLEPLGRVATDHGLALIEDAAQAHLAEYRGRKVGGFGQIAAFSFYPGKNLGAYGEGGAATTNDPQLARQLRLLRDWGQQQKYHHEMLAYNYRMDAVQGAILRVKMRHLEAWTERRRHLAALYREKLAPLGFVTSTEAPERRHVYHIFSIFHPQRDAIQRWLGERGIQTGLHYPVPVHLQQAYRELRHRRGDFPNAERIAAEQLSLPLYPELAEDDVEAVVEALRGWANQPSSGK